MSTVNLLHYREWHGPLRGPWASVWPITRVALIVNLLGTVPALILFAQHGLDDLAYFTDPDYFTAQGRTGPSGYELLLAILGFGLVQSVCLAIVLVATATWARRTMPLIMVW